MTDNKLQHPEQEGWVVVGYATGLTDAEITAGMLRSFNIPVFIHQEAVARALGLTIGLGMIRILVPAQFEEAALELLEANDRDDPTTSLDGPPLIFPEGE
ncbi:MAG: DUF2007 domain-containing protein [Chloroflexi bacterium]|nr:DUF2007 domain-containing protein [Chloroflexota bacterium]